MARLSDNKDLLVALRRFATQPLTGSDLAEIRISLLGMNQTELGHYWGFSRARISRMEKKEIPSRKTCDAYIGLMVCIVLGFVPSHPDGVAGARRCRGTT